MVTYTNFSYREKQDIDVPFVAEIACLSTDTKPTKNILTGSTLTEVDTGDVYMFDGTNWIKQFSLRG